MDLVTYVWNEESSFLISKALGSKCIREKIISFFFNFSCSDNVANALTAFNDITDAGCKITFRKKINVKGKKRIPKKKWFDEDLQSLHKELARKVVPILNTPMIQLFEVPFLNSEKYMGPVKRKCVFGSLRPV